MSATRILQPDLCDTCPFRPGVARKYRAVAGIIAVSALTEAARICHSTGEDNLFHETTGHEERLCAGAHALRLRVWFATGFLRAPTTEAWNERMIEQGMEPLVVAEDCVRRARR